MMTTLRDKNCDKLRGQGRPPQREERDLDRRNDVWKGLEDLEHTETQSARWGMVEEAAEVVRSQVMKALCFLKPLY